MVTNPYAAPPNSPSSADAWTRGFLVAFEKPETAIDPPDGVNDAAAYGEGVQAGRQATIDGLDLRDDPCIAAQEPSAESIGLVVDGVEGLGVAWAAVAGHLAGGVAELIVLLIHLGSSAESVLPPDQTVLPGLAQPLLDTMSNYGVGSLELFCAAGLDVTSNECEMKISALYRTIDRARAAGAAFARPNVAVVSWRTDQCGSFKIIESS